MINFKNEEGFHTSIGCKIDYELKENVYTFEVRSKLKSGKLMRTYKVLKSSLNNYIDELKKDPSVKLL